MNRRHDCFAGKPAGVHNFKALTIKKVLFFGLYLRCYTELCFQIKICRSPCGKVRRGTINGTGHGFAQKIKSTIFDKTNKTGDHN